MSMREVLRPAWPAAFPAVLIGGALWFFGLAWPFAVAAAVLVIALVIAWGAHAGATTPEHSVQRLQPRAGTRPDFARTAWSLHERRGTVTDSGRKRLRGFARRRLARHGLDLDAPAAAPPLAALIGPRAWAALDGDDTLRLTEVEHCIDMLEAIDLGTIDLGTIHATPIAHTVATPTPTAPQAARHDTTGAPTP